MTKEIKMEFNRDDLWHLHEVLRGFIGTQIVDGHTYMLNEAIELKKRIDKKCKFKT
jgi:hypothetical protein